MGLCLAKDDCSFTEPPVRAQPPQVRNLININEKLSLINDEKLDNEKLDTALINTGGPSTAGPQVSQNDEKSNTNLLQKKPLDEDLSEHVINVETDYDNAQNLKERAWAALKEFSGNRDSDWYQTVLESRPNPHKMPSESDKLLKYQEVVGSDLFESGKPFKRWTGFDAQVEEMFLSTVLRVIAHARGIPGVSRFPLPEMFEKRFANNTEELESLIANLEVGKNEVLVDALKKIVPLGQSISDLLGKLAVKYRLEEGGTNNLKLWTLNSFQRSAQEALKTASPPLEPHINFSWRNAVQALIYGVDHVESSDRKKQLRILAQRYPGVEVTKLPDPSKWETLVRMENKDMFVHVFEELKNGSLVDSVLSEEDRGALIYAPLPNICLHGTECYNRETNGWDDMQLNRLSGYPTESCSNVEFQSSLYSNKEVMIKDVTGGGSYSTFKRKLVREGQLGEGSAKDSFWGGVSQSMTKQAKENCTSGGRFEPSETGIFVPDVLALVDGHPRMALYDPNTRKMEGLGQMRQCFLVQQVFEHEPSFRAQAVKAYNDLVSFKKESHKESHILPSVDLVPSIDMKSTPFELRFVVVWGVAVGATEQLLGANSHVTNQSTSAVAQPAGRKLRDNYDSMDSEDTWEIGLADPLSAGRENRFGTGLPPKVLQLMDRHLKEVLASHDDAISALSLSEKDKRDKRDIKRDILSSFSDGELGPLYRRVLLKLARQSEVLAKAAKAPFFRVDYLISSKQIVVNEVESVSAMSPKAMSPKMRDAVLRDENLDEGVATGRITGWILDMVGSGFLARQKAEGQKAEASLIDSEEEKKTNEEEKKTDSGSTESEEEKKVDQ